MPYTKQTKLTPKRYHYEVKQGIGWRAFSVVARTRAEADKRAKTTGKQIRYRRVTKV